MKRTGEAHELTTSLILELAKRGHRQFFHGEIQKAGVGFELHWTKMYSVISGPDKEQESYCATAIKIGMKNWLPVETKTEAELQWLNKLLLNALRDDEIQQSGAITWKSSNKSFTSLLATGKPNRPILPINQEMVIKVRKKMEQLRWYGVEVRIEEI